MTYFSLFFLFVWKQKQGKTKVFIGAIRLKVQFIPVLFRCRNFFSCLPRDYRARPMTFLSRTENAAWTIHVSNLDFRVDEVLLWELFTHVGIVVEVTLPRDPIEGTHKQYAFVEFHKARDAQYACCILNGIKLYDQVLKVTPRMGTIKDHSILGNLGSEEHYIRLSGLDPETDEIAITETFSKFGRLVGFPEIQRDPYTGESLGIAVIGYASAQHAEKAIDMMDKQYFRNRLIRVKRTKIHGGKPQNS